MTLSAQYGPFTHFAQRCSERLPMTMSALSDGLPRRSDSAQLALVLPVPVHPADRRAEPGVAPPARRLLADGSDVPGVPAAVMPDLHRARLVEDGVDAAARP